MIFDCSFCNKKYEEKDEDAIKYGTAGCKMMCYECSTDYIIKALLEPGNYAKESRLPDSGPMRK